MADPARARRLAKRISTIVASAIEFEIKDPGLDGITVVDTKMTADLHDATVFYTVMGPTLDDEPDYATAAAALDRAKGTLRTMVGAGTGVRFTPTLTFTRDTTADAVQRMDELLAQARAAFRSSHHHDGQRLADLLSSGHTDAAARLAHQLRGSAATLGLNHLAALARALEQDLAGEAELPLLSARCSDIHSELELACARFG